MQLDWMQWIQCSLVKFIPIECSGFHAVWLNAVWSMQHAEMEPYWMQWILCSMSKASRLYAVDCMKRHWMQSSPFIVVQWITIVCSGVHAARPNASRLNAVDFIQHGPNIPIECRGFHAVWVNAVESMPRGPMHPDWIPWIPCSVNECIGVHAAWWNASLLNAVYTLQRC